MKNKNTYIAVAIAVVVAAALFGLDGFFIPQTVQNQGASINDMLSDRDTNQNMNVTQLKIEDVVVGKGVAAKNGDLLTVNYTGHLPNGSIFDSSLNPGRTPFQFELGGHMVISGWDEGLVGMKVGGKRKLTIPPDKAYGAEGATNPQTGEVIIPPQTPLQFDVELLKIQSK